MPDVFDCSQCGHRNDPGARFCAECGANMEPRATCAACGGLNPVGNRFCIHCGAEMAGARWQPDAVGGAVLDGVWERGPEEFIRRVDPEDCRTTLLGSKVVRVPPGTVGAVMVDGVVERLLPPGQQTTLNLFERVARFFTGGTDRTAFYLIDTRPVPVPFTVNTRPTAQGRAIQTQVLVSFALRRGDKAGISSFVDQVMGERYGYSASDLYNRLRPEVTRRAGLVLERMAGEGAFRYHEAEAGIREALEDELGARYGMSATVTVAPLTTVASLNFHLGTGSAPQVRPCEDCGAELPATMRFCDRCGARQPALLVPERRCGACDGRVNAGDGFCAACGAAYVPPPVEASPLFTADGQQIELDLVVRVQGQHEDFTPERITPALVGGVAAALRELAYGELVTPEGFEALEADVREPVEKALTSYGLRLVGLSVIDARGKTGQWLLGARADLERARKELTVGREWLGQRAEELDLEELTLAQRLDQQRVARAATLRELAMNLAAGRHEDGLKADDRFARDERALTDRKRREELADEGAELDAAAARRKAERDLAVAEAERRVEEDALAAARRREREAIAHAMDKDRASADHGEALERQKMGLDADRERQRMQLDAERAETQLEVERARADLAQDVKDREEQRQLDKLRAMAELDRDMAAQEHAQTLAQREQLKGLDEGQMLALQAEALSKGADGGRAWAEALTARAEAQAQAQRLDDAKAHAAELREVLQAQLDRLGGVADSALQAAAATRSGAADEGVYEASMEAMGRVAASRAAPETAAASATAVSGGDVPTRACPQCGHANRLTAKFCGGCGAAVGEEPV